jgi:hypothetical protein
MQEILELHKDVKVFFSATLLTCFSNAPLSGCWLLADGCWLLADGFVLWLKKL